MLEILLRFLVVFLLFLKRRLGASVVPRRLPLVLQRRVRLGASRQLGCSSCASAGYPASSRSRLLSADWRTLADSRRLPQVLQRCFRLSASRRRGCSCFASAGYPASSGLRLLTTDWRTLAFLCLRCDEPDLLRELSVQDAQVNGVMPMTAGNCAASSPQRRSLSS